MNIKAVVELTGRTALQCGEMCDEVMGWDADNVILNLLPCFGSVK